MAVTPILQSINAFDVTASNYEEIIEGVTVHYCAIISFNVTGDAQFIRSNTLTIYDSETSEIVATNTYNSLLLVNKVPTDLQGLANGRSYYATIELFDQTNGRGNSLGVSNAKQFWCLPSPTLTITQPASSIPDYERSVYNFIAEFEMYPSEYSSLASVVTNKIQSYQFDLYKGSYSSAILIKSSGVIFNTGSTLDNNTYIINNIFADLQNDVSYFVIVKITTEQGMTVETTSHIISVIVESLTFSVAQVTNKSCEGCIEIQSNITNISGYTNAEYTTGDGYIDLTNSGEYVVWGYDVSTGERDDSIVFPYSTEDGIARSKWSFFIVGKNFTPSASSVVNPLDESYILKLRDYQNTNSGCLYYRDDGTEVWLELYIATNDSNSNNVVVKSNALLKSDITSNTTLYILIRCNDGWYDVTISDSL